MSVRSVITRRAAHHRERTAFYAREAAQAHRAWNGGQTEATSAVIGRLMGLAYRSADVAERYEAALRPGPDGGPAWVDRMDAMWGSETDRLGDEAGVGASSGPAVPA